MSIKTDSSVLEKTKLKTPSMWTVVFHNDDYTPMDFVVNVLKEIFHIGEEAAFDIMLTVHTDGRCPVGKFTKEIAETKASEVLYVSAKNQHPLQVTPEEL